MLRPVLVNEEENLQGRSFLRIMDVPPEFKADESPLSSQRITWTKDGWSFQNSELFVAEKYLILFSEKSYRNRNGLTNQNYRKLLLYLVCPQHPVSSWSPETLKLHKRKRVSLTLIHEKFITTIQKWMNLFLFPKARKPTVLPKVILF